MQAKNLYLKVGWGFRVRILALCFCATLQVGKAEITECAKSHALVAGTDCKGLLKDYRGEIKTSDPSAVRSIVQNPAPGTRLPFGFNQITFVVTETNGITFTCSSVVIVADLTAPKFTPLPELTISCSAVWEFGTPIATDACSEPEIKVLSTVTNQTGGVSYVATRTWKAEDGSGNSATMSQRVTVVDTNSPVVLGAPANLALVAGTNCLARVPDLTTQVVVTDCSPFTIRQSPEAGSFLAIGASEILLKATDENHLTTEVRVPVVVFETTPPLITASPADRSIGMGTNCLALLPDLTGEVVASDSCGSVGITQAPAAGTLLGFGRHTITFTVTDVSTNTATSSMVLDVIDNSAPVLVTTVTNLTLAAGTNCAALLPDLAGQVVASDCSPFAVTQLPLAGTELALGTNLVSITVTDTNNLSTVVGVEVVVADRSPPEFSVVTNRTAECSAVWEFDVPVATDLCSTALVSVVETVTNLTGTATYVASRSWAAVDGYGNSTTVTQVVSVVDTIPPQITASPADRSVGMGTNCLALLPDMTGEIVASDACGSVGITQEPIPGTLLALGRHTITFTAVDAATNTATSTMVLDVIDNSAPVLVVTVTNLTLTAGTNCSAVLPDLAGQVVATDCSPLAVTQSPLAGTELALGTNQVSITVTDTNNLITVVGVEVVVADRTPPEFGVITNRTVECSAVWEFDVPVATDLCSTTLVSVVETVTNQTGAGVYVASRVWEAVDGYGNSSTVTQMVTVLDAIAPQITASPADRNIGMGTNCLALLPDLRSEVVASHGCGDITISQEPAPGTLLGFGKHTVTFTVADAATNTATSSMVLDVIDNSAPVLVTTVTNLTLAAGTNCAALLPDLAGQVVATDCSPLAVTQSPLAGTELAIGTNLVSITVTDTNNLSTVVGVEVVVADQTPPEFSVITNRTVECSAIWEFDVPVATDLCSTTLVSVVETVTNQTGAGVYVASRVWEAVDGYGNSSTVTQMVTVLDAIAPQITASPADRNIGMGTNCLALLPDLRSEVVASHGCGDITISQEPAPGTLLGFGKHTVTFTVADGATNTATSSMVLDVIDNSAPVLVTTVTNLTLAAGTNCAALLPDLAGQVVATDCSPLAVTQSPLAGTELALGTNLVSITVTDTNNLSTVVGVEVVVADQTPPEFSVITNRTVECSAIWEFDVPVATDLCSTTLVSVVETVTNLTGTATYVASRSWEAIDGYGNSTTVTQVVSVVDTIPPQITASPADRSIGLGTNCLALLPDLTGEVVASDACSSGGITQEPIPGTLLALGRHTITFTVVDAATNTATSTMVLDVIDNSAPVLVSTMTNLTLAAGTNCAALLPDLAGQVVATDCSPFAVTQSPLAGTELALGTNQVSITVTDTNNLITVVGVEVVVADRTPPEFGVITNRTVECSAVWEFDVPVATDLCSTTLLSVLETVTNQTGAGVYVASRVWEAVDGYGNSSTVTQMVTVLDAIAPQITASPADRNIGMGTNCLALLPDLRSEVVASHGCGDITISQEPAPGTLLGFGKHTVTFTVADGATNTATSSMMLDVIDNSAPVLVTTVTNLTLAAGTNCAALLPDLAGQVVASDCSPFAVSQIPLAGTELGLGTNLVSITVTDTNNLSTVVGVEVVVADQTPPEFSVITNRTVECSAIWEFDVPVATDLCSTTLVSVVETVTNLTGTATYVVSRSWEAIDGYGNSTTVTQIVSVVDTIPPQITASPADRSVGMGTNCLALLPDLTGEVVASDACGSVGITQEPTPGTLLGFGRHTITFTVVDVATNTATSSMVLDVIDNSAPVLVGTMTNLTLAAGTNCAALLPDLAGQLIATDCSPFAITQTPLAGAELALGTNIVTLTLTDTNNLSTAVGVEVVVVDQTPPVFSVLTNRIVEASVVWEFDVPVATDLCSTTLVSVVETLTNTTGTATYVATRSWEAVDGYGNSATVTQVVNVVNTAPPQITACPPDRSVGMGTNCLALLPDLTGEVIASDVGGSLRITQEPIPGTLLAFGRNTINFTVVGSGTNTATCSMVLDVIDNSAPVVADTITVMALAAGTNCAALLPDLTGRVVASDCSPFVVTQSPLAGTELALGTNLVSITLTDTNNLSTVVGVEVVVADRTPPEFSVVTNRTVECSAVWEFDVPVATDLCSTTLVSVVETVTNMTGTATYEAIRSWEAIDGYGNSATVTQVVSVVDTTAPQITASPADRGIGMGTNCLALLPDLTGEVVASDVCGSINITQEPAPGTLLGFGRHTITFTVADTATNTTTSSMVVDVIDNSAPVLLLPLTNVSLIVGGSCVGLLPDLTGQVVASDCSPFVVRQTPPPGTEVPVGMTNILMTLVDEFGNSVDKVHVVAVRTPPSANTNISITELMAKNLTSIVDEDGTHADWIELYNRGSCPMNMDGWFLTDDPAKMAKWRFPGTVINPGQFLIVWASEKNRKVVGSPLHTNFKLAEGGEYLALVEPDGFTIATQFSPTFPPQAPDGTFGQPITGGPSNYLAYATPGAANSPATNSTVADLEFKPARGWFTNVFDVSIHTPTEALVPGVKIYYTTNGTVPGPTNGFLYNQHVIIANTTVLRAAAYCPGMSPSAPVSHTYIFPLQVPQQTGAGFPPQWGPDTAQYAMSPTIVRDPQWGTIIPHALVSLPTVSLSINTEDMFGTNGIYANPFGDGTAWERPVGVEFMRNDSRPGFYINCGVQLQGDLSRDPAETMKHNLRLYFRQSYGASGLSYELFSGSPITNFNTLVLHASFNDHWIQLGAKAQMIRDQWVADTQREIGGLGTHGEFVNLYINGLYWGLYNLGERPDAAYTASYLGGVRADYDGFNADELKDGNTNAWNEMMSIARAGITNDESYALLGQYVDIPDFIDYLIINFYAANLDWPIHNFWLVGSVPNGIPFHFLSWDAEVSFIGINWDLTGINTGTPGLIYSALRAHPDFVRQFGDHAQRLLFDRGALTPDRCTVRWMHRATEIHEAIVAESARWGVSWRTNTQSDWLQEQNLLKSEWFPNRTDILIDQFRVAGLLPSLQAPTLQPHGGLIPAHDPLNVTLLAPVGTIYYTTNGTDPRLPDGTLSPDALEYGQPLSLTEPVGLMARTFSGGGWSALVQAGYVRADQTQIRIQTVTRRFDGSVQLGFAAYPGVVYTLRYSTDLNDWHVLGTFSPDSNGRFDYLDISGAPGRFYQLSWP